MDYKSGIKGRAVVHFGGKIAVGTAQMRDDDSLCGLALAELFDDVKIGADINNVLRHDVQVLIWFNDMESIDKVQDALDNIREMLMRKAEEKEKETKRQKNKHGRCVSTPANR